jgi:hypothetical protein
MAHLHWQSDSQKCATPATGGSWPGLACTAVVLAVQCCTVTPCSCTAVTVHGPMTRQDHDQARPYSIQSRRIGHF